MSPPNELPPQGTASLSDILTTQQDLVRATNAVVDGIGALSPHFSSGQLIAAKLVQTSFVRLLGYSVVTANSIGFLADAANLAAATASTTSIVGIVEATPGFYPVNMIFQNGLVYIPSSAQVATLFYART